MPDYKKDREMSDKYIPLIKQIVGPRLLESSNLELDMKEATDLIILRASDIRIACRVRRPGYLDRYVNDFTMRIMRDSGAETEHKKLIDGFGDWFFYAHISNDWKEFSTWMIVDLSAWRAHLIRRVQGSPLFIDKDNGDGTYFRAYDVTTFSGNPPILIDRKLPKQQLKTFFPEKING